MFIVVTGGAGFLGSHLCERLLELGHRVCCLDNLITGRRENIASFESNPRFEFRLHDVSKPFSIDGPVDAVMHFASPASPPHYLKFPIQTLEVGSLGTHNCLEVAKVKRARFLLASTSEVYGDPLVHPQREDYWGNVNTVGPRAVYDEAKRYGEAVSLAYHRYHELDTRIVRIFNTYGPRMRPDDGRVVSNFIVQALTGQNLTVYGDGMQTRSLCYASDLIEGILQLLFLDASGVHAPVNLGNPHELTVSEIAAVVLRLTGTSNQIVHEPLPVDDPKQRCPDISLAQTLLGWTPKVGLIEGLQHTIEYFRTELNLAPKLWMGASRAEGASTFHETE